MTTVTIFGSGNMGNAIAGVLASGGASVDHIRSDDPPGPVSGDIVILAVPHSACRKLPQGTATSLQARSSSISPIR